MYLAEITYMAYVCGDYSFSASPCYASNYRPSLSAGNPARIRGIR